MPADTAFFWNDLMHISQTSRVLSASSIQGGYSIDNAREAELFNAWKPNDSAIDEWLKVDGSATTWLGAASAQAYFVIAYDARACNQDSIQLQVHSLDDGTFTGGVITDGVTHTLNKTEPTCFYAGFLVPSPTPRRWYRLIQKAANRTGGNIPAKILSWGMFTAADVTFLNINFPGHSAASVKINSLNRTSRMKGAGAMTIANKFAMPGQSIAMTFQQEQDAFYTKIRDSFKTLSGMGRAIYLQQEGLSNAALANFFMCRLADDWKSERTYKDQSDMSINLETEACL